MPLIVATIWLLATSLVLVSLATSSQVPSEPFVNLNVLSNSAIGVNIALPIDDGGSAINSYVVEWDTNPGIREVQTVSTTTVNGSFEIQSITTSAKQRYEVQTITSSAQAVPEVQQITVTGATGGYFFVALDTSSSGGSLQYSGTVYVSYPASGTVDGRDAENIIAAMDNVDFGVVVTRARGANTGDYVYSITFPPSMGNVPQMSVISSSLTPVPTAVAAVSTAVEGNIIGGSYRLQFSGETTASLDYDAGSNDVRVALEALSSVGTVVVTRTGPDYQNGFVWTVTFTSPVNTGNVPAIIPQYSGLTVSSVGASVSMAVASQDGNQLGGTFTLLWKNTPTSGSPTQGTTVAIPYDATAAQFEAILNGMSGNVLPTGSIAVSRTGPDGQLGYTWLVTFLENSAHTFSGSQQPFVWDQTSKATLTGSESSVTVAYVKQFVANRIPIGGNFALTFRGQRTTYLPCDASARAVADALRALNSIGDVDVVRTVTADANNGYTWSVTFLTELGSLDPMLFDGQDLTGTAATGVVARYRPGVAPPFNSLDPARALPLGMQAVTDMQNPSLAVTNLDQGVAYYFRVAAVNSDGFQGPYAYAPNRYAVPQLQLPRPPVSAALTVVGGSTMQVAFDASPANGGADVNFYKVCVVQCAVCSV